MENGNYIKVPDLSWASIYCTCQEHGLNCIELMFVTKYPVNSERLIGFSEKTQTNVQMALVLYHYKCETVTLTQDSHPDILTDDEYQWLLPYLQQNNLLNHEIYLFYRDPNPEPNIQEINYTQFGSDSYHYQKGRIFVYSNYVIRLWYIINNVGCPNEIKTLFDKGLINSVYVRQISNKLIKNVTSM